MARVAVGIWLALSLATTFVSAATFAGCVSALPPDALKLLIVPDCNFCSTMGFSYSYASGGECWCSTFSPQVAVYQSYAPATGCPAGSFTVTKLVTTFDYVGCTNAPIYTPADAARPVTGLPMTQCFANCATLQYAVMYPNGGNGWECRCALDSVVLTALPGGMCGTFGYAVYQHSLAEASAGLTRKRRAIQSPFAEDICRWGTAACNVGSGGYECLDLQTELYSCGGCVEGSFDNKTSTPGTDCTTLPGIKRGGVTCHKGQCVVSGCRAGWRKENGRCVRKGR